MDIRVLKSSDIPHVQLANITNLPENYFCKYYLYHAQSWPQLSYVAVDVSWVLSLSSLSHQSFCSVYELPLERAGITIGGFNKRLDRISGIHRHSFGSI